MTAMKRLLLSGSLLAASSAVAAAAPATVGTDLYLRSGPGTGYGVIETMPAGAEVDATDCAGGWCRVAFDGAEGYAGRAYLDVETAVGPMSGPYAYGYPSYAYDAPYAYPGEGIAPDIVGGVVNGVVNGVLIPALSPFWRDEPTG